ncbi:MAG: hypothetical protein ACTSQV_04685 [Alphaproteobacteria bacterium]
MTVSASRESLKAGPGSWPGAGISVRIWLFGALASLSTERPLALTFPAGSTARDVVAAMAARCKPGFLDQVLCADGSLLRHCRLFADGLPIDDLDAPLGEDGGAIEIEMILLMGYEGG